MSTTLRLWRRSDRLVTELTAVEDDAFPATGKPRLTDVAPVQNQPVMRVVPELLRCELDQLALDLFRGLARGQTGAIGDAEDMGVDGDGGLTKGDGQDDGCSLAADARQPGESVMIGRHLACVLGNQLPRQRNHILGLGAKQSDGLNIWNEPRLAELDHGLRRVC